MTKGNTSNWAKAWKQLAKGYRRLYDDEQRSDSYDLSRYKAFILALDTAVCELTASDTMPRFPMEFAGSLPDLLIAERERSMEIELKLRKAELEVIKLKTKLNNNA